MLLVTQLRDKVAQLKQFMGGVSWEVIDLLELSANTLEETQKDLTVARTRLKKVEHELDIAYKQIDTVPK